jgi:hypothetical protein
VKLFDIGQEATGVIAIGQIATGVVAIGQLATGFIAIGQAARGVIAIGMGAFGLWSVGMASFGVVKAVGLIGIAARAGPGFILPLLPRFTEARTFPKQSPAAAARAGSEGGAWVRSSLVEDGGTIGLQAEGQALAFRSDAASQHALGKLWSQGKRDILAWLHGDGHGALRLAGLMEPPAPPWREARFWPSLVLRLAALTLLAIAYWIVVGVPLGSVLHAALG